MGKNKARKAKAPKVDENKVKPVKEQQIETNNKPLAKSGMQNKKRADSSKDTKPAEAKPPKVASAEPKEAAIKDEPKKPTVKEEVGSSVGLKTPEKVAEEPTAEGTPNLVDAWFQRQRRELSTVTELPETEDGEACDISFMSMNESFSQADAASTQTCDAASTFDMWLERQKKHLGTLNTQVSVLGSPTKLDHFKELQANKSQESLKQWRERLQAGSDVSKSAQEKRAGFEMDAEFKQHITELERAADKVEDDFLRMRELAEQNKVLEEASQAEKLWNLTNAMQDSIHGLAPMTPGKAAPEDSAQGEGK